MPEGLKISQSVSPATRAGAGDISERELSRERCNFTTPPARVQRTLHKKQLFSTPVNKFTAKNTAPSTNLARIRSCLDEYHQTPARPAKIGPKAVSMEDLTPAKKVKRERNDGHLAILKSPGLHGIDEEQAAARISKFMLVVSWRRRREEIRCVRKTLECQVSCSERLRIQVVALKSLLDSDNAKVRLAIKELERLKQLLKEKDLEKAILEKEKIALEQDVCAAEDRASEISIGWRSCRAELECARAAAAAAERALADERAARRDLRRRIATLEDDLSHHEASLSASEAQVTVLRNDINTGQRLLDQAREELRLEREARERCARECAALGARAALSALEAAALSADAEHMRAELARLARELSDAREQLDWWPAPLTKMLGVARTWMRRPMSLSDAVVWSLIPARHGC